MLRTAPIKPLGTAACRLLWWLVAALLFGQSFGALHRIVHMPASSVVVGEGGQPRAGSGPQVGPSTWAHWFGSHSANDCALIDHLLQPTPSATPAVLPEPVVAAATPSLAMAGIVPAGRASFFQARAPPPLQVRTSSL